MYTQNEVDAVMNRKRRAVTDLDRTTARGPKRVEPKPRCMSNEHIYTNTLEHCSVCRICGYIDKEHIPEETRGGDTIACTECGLVIESQRSLTLVDQSTMSESRITQEHDEQVALMHEVERRKAASHSNAIEQRLSILTAAIDRIEHTEEHKKSTEARLEMMTRTKENKSKRRKHAIRCRSRSKGYTRIVERATIALEKTLSKLEAEWIECHPDLPEQYFDRSSMKRVVLDVALSGVVARSDLIATFAINTVAGCLHTATTSHTQRRQLRAIQTAYDNIHRTGDNHRPTATDTETIEWEGDESSNNNNNNNDKETPSTASASSESAPQSSTLWYYKKNQAGPEPKVMSQTTRTVVLGHLDTLLIRLGLSDVNRRSLLAHPQVSMFLSAAPCNQRRHETIAGAIVWCMSHIQPTYPELTALTWKQLELVVAKLHAENNAVAPMRLEVLLSHAQKPPPQLDERFVNNPDDFFDLYMQTTHRGVSVEQRQIECARMQALYPPHGIPSSEEWTKLVRYASTTDSSSNSNATDHSNQQAAMMRRFTLHLIKGGWLGDPCTIFPKNRTELEHIEAHARCTVPFGQRTRQALKQVTIAIRDAVADDTRLRIQVVPRDIADLEENPDACWMNVCQMARNYLNLTLTSSCLTSEIRKQASTRLDQQLDLTRTRFGGVRGLLNALLTREHECVAATLVAASMENHPNQSIARSFFTAKHVMDVINRQSSTNTSDGINKRIVTAPPMSTCKTKLKEKGCILS